MVPSYPLQAGGLQMKYSRNSRFDSTGNPAQHIGALGKAAAFYLDCLANATLCLIMLALLWPAGYRCGRDIAAQQPRVFHGLLAGIFPYAGSHYDGGDHCGPEQSAKTPLLAVSREIARLGAVCSALLCVVLRVCMGHGGQAQTITARQARRYPDCSLCGARPGHATAGFRGG